MILVDNRNILRLKNRELLNDLSAIEGNSEAFNAVVEPSRAGIPTLKLKTHEKTQYVHSKYDPEKEAERLMNQLENIETVNHILFFGSGLGYHIQKFSERYPDKRFSIYEPDKEVFVNYLSTHQLSNLPQDNLGKIISGIEEPVVFQEIAALLQDSHGMLRVYALPVYESLYDDLLTKINKQILGFVKDKRSSLGTDLSFQKRWTVNSIKNFPTVLKTPNILHDVNKSAFEGKPAIIVAAGPSLNEEFENLRYIKENGLAYIFSVGSAINALIEYGIYPDAACTYDPKERNQNVIKIIKERGIINVPLIFGSSVGYETLEDYPGKMLHMITSQDAVSKYLLKSEKKIQIVQDAPSIAVITFQLLTQLGFNEIILVGQNLSFLNEKRFASGIEYDHISNTISEQERHNLLVVKDVTGKNIYTDESFNRMRQQLEMYIQRSSNVKVINTTVGGAQIEGTSHIGLAKLIESSFKKNVVNRNWLETQSGYSVNIVLNNIRKIEKELTEYEDLLKKSLNKLKNISHLILNNNLLQLENSYLQLDKEINNLKENLFFKSYIKPMIRVQYNRLAQEIDGVRYEKDRLKKGKYIFELFDDFLMECQQHYQYVCPLFQEMKSKVY